MQSIEIQPGRMVQVTRAMKSDRLIAVDDDVQNVANDLHAIDPHLKLVYEPYEDVWIVKYQQLTAGGEVEERLVSSFQECDQRIVRRMREINRPGYDFVAELDRLDREAERRADHEFSEKIGPHAEKLAWALRQDLGRNERAVVPADVPKG
jgi:hypothetical protein